VKFRRLLFAAMLGICFDVAVPLEQTAQGTLVWEDDEEEAVRGERRQQRSPERKAAPKPAMAAVAQGRAVARRRLPRPARRPAVSRVAHAAAAPPPPSPTEDH
jgi:hypothetical protein